MRYKDRMINVILKKMIILYCENLTALKGRTDILCGCNAALLTIRAVGT